MSNGTTTAIQRHRDIAVTAAACGTFRGKRQIGGGSRAAAGHAAVVAETRRPPRLARRAASGPAGAAEGDGARAVPDWRLRPLAVPGDNLATRKGNGMALNFPNQMRSYDASRRAVRFWGHDSAMEASFFVTEDALKRSPSGHAVRRGRTAQRIRRESRPHLRSRSQGLCARPQRLIRPGRRRLSDRTSPGVLTQMLSAGRSILASTSAAQERTITATETPAQSGRPSSPTCRPEPIRLSVALAPNKSGERNSHAITFDPARQLAHASPAGRRRRRCRNRHHRLQLGRMDVGKHREANGRAKDELCPRRGSCPHVRQQVPRGSRRRAADGRVQEGQLMDAGDSYIQKGGWATFPGMGSPDLAIAQACAKLLTT